MNTTTTMTDADWDLLEQAVGRQPTRTTPKAAPTPEEPPPELLRVRTADEILAEDNAQAKARKATVPTKNGNHTSAADTGIVYADQHAPKPAPEPTTAPATSDSAVLVELRAIREELRSLCALVATGVNKMPSRGGRS
jgi:hypothetical protein